MWRMVCSRSWRTFPHLWWSRYCCRSHRSWCQDVPMFLINYNVSIMFCDFLGQFYIVDHNCEIMYIFNMRVIIDEDVRGLLYRLTLYIKKSKRFEQLLVPRELELTNGQIPQSTSPISHNAPFKTDMCAFLFWMVRVLWGMGQVQSEICEIGLLLKNVPETTV